jgi:homotetrameric cytidine deaminase
MSPTDENPLPSLHRLLDLARQAAQNAYAPYSGFRVGAALLLHSGQVVTGTNVENASYGLTICAERAAVARAISQFGPLIRIQAVAITNLNNAPSPPCGACRQVLSEFIAPDAPVLFPTADGVLTVPFPELFPFTFNLQQK